MKKSTTIKDLIAHLEGYADKDTPIAYILWNVDDVKHAAENNGVVLTDEEIDEVLYLVEKQHDCNYGITWDTLYDIVSDVVIERK